MSEMRKINIKNYKVELKGKLVNYSVKDTMINMILHPAHRHTGKSLLESNLLAEKFENCKEENILISEDEYSKLQHGMKIVTGWSKNEVEFVKRIEYAELVSVEESKGEKNDDY